MSDAEPLTVWYNGACPVCRAEIGHYRARSRPGDGLAWRDVAAAGPGELPKALEGDTRFRRMHATTRDGRLLAGVDAFIAVWERLAGYRWLARLMRRRPMRHVGGLLYDRVAAPALFRRHQRRQWAP